jgi:hypothetical protein
MILATHISKDGYVRIAMSVGGQMYWNTVHSIEASAFYGYNPKTDNVVVDHINGIRSDNRLSNLRLITQRENVSCGFMSKGTKSKVTGVFKIRNKWTVYIRKDGINIFIGSFDDKYEAGRWYSDAVYSIENNLPIKIKKAVYASTYNGVTWHKSSKMWMARKLVDGSRKYLGLFETDEEAYNAIKSYSCSR